MKYTFKVGDKVRLLDTGSSISNKKDFYAKNGAVKGSIVTIKGITPHGGEASVSDPRYYGDNFNVRGHELELVKSNSYEVYN